MDSSISRRYQHLTSQRRTCFTGGVLGCGVDLRSSRLSGRRFLHRTVRTRDLHSQPSHRFLSPQVDPEMHDSSMVLHSSGDLMSFCPFGPSTPGVQVLVPLMYLYSANTSFLLDGIICYDYEETDFPHDQIQIRPHLFRKQRYDGRRSSSTEGLTGLNIFRQPRKITVIYVKTTSLTKPIEQIRNLRITPQPMFYDPHNNAMRFREE
uniref:Uncharacterized protein n=1 Tax=Cannabis sativa TaxID=3483 RepID=A0A803QLM1_CANSA